MRLSCLNIQLFAGHYTSKTRRPLGGFDPEMNIETFGISRDGTRMTIASPEKYGLNLMLAERVPGIPPRCGPHDKRWRPLVALNHPFFALE